MRRVCKVYFGVMMAIFALHKVHGGNFYLALVGPPPLRFETMITNDIAFTRELAFPVQKDTKASVAILATNSPLTTNALSPPSASAKTITPKTSLGVSNDAAKNSKGRLNPANNLLSTMPQMITQDLKPGQSEVDTNSYQPGDIIFVPTELEFVPPMPARSRAIYRTR